MRLFPMLMFAATAATVSAGPVFAHAHLRSADPSVDGASGVVPHAVTIIFSEAVEPKFCTIEVKDPAGQRVDHGAPHLVDGDGTKLAVDLATLPPATYTVVWHATAVDTHKTEGTFQFSVIPHDASAISLEHPWARASAGPSTTGAAYLTVTDNGTPDVLTGVSTPVAATADLHESIDDHGVMKMRPLGQVALDPGKPVTFKPGGYHIMLMGLKAPLKAGESFPLTLTFAHAQPITVNVKVGSASGAAEHEHHHDAMEGMSAMPGMQHPTN